jgi:hypothetical protein
LISLFGSLSHDNISLSAHNLFFNQQNTGGQLHALKMEWQELCQKNIAIQAACVDLQNHIDQLKLEAKELYVYSLLPPSLSLGLFIVWLQPSPTQEDHSKPHIEAMYMLVCIVSKPLNPWVHLLPAVGAPSYLIEVADTGPAN